VLAQGCGFGEARGAAARSHTLWPASSGHPKCREKATCVHGPGHCERLADRRDSSGVPSCEATSRGVHGSPAVCILEEKKTFCCVTTRRRNLWTLSDLGCGLGLLTAHSLCLGVLDLGGGFLAVFRLPLRRLPAVDLSQAFRILAVSLVPAPRLVFASTSFAQAYPPAWSAPAGQTAALCFNVRDAHGSCNSQGKSSGRMLIAFSSGAIKTRVRRLPASLSSSREQDSKPRRSHLVDCAGNEKRAEALPFERSSSRQQHGKTNGLVHALGTRTSSAAFKTIVIVAESEIGPTLRYLTTLK
jgi:hypothetical protein